MTGECHRGQPPLSIVIPAHGTRELTLGYLESLASAAPVVEVIVVDDASADGTAEAIAPPPQSHGHGQRAASRLCAVRQPGSRGLALLGALLAGGDPAAAQIGPIDPGIVVQTIQASLWSPPSTDTAGITYRPDTGELISCDSEVDETVSGITFYAGVNIWTHTRTGIVTGPNTTTLPWSNEPTGIAGDPAGGRLWTSDDDQKRIYEIKFGLDGIWNTADDVRTSLRGYNTAGCDDFEDVAYDNLNGHLYVSSGNSQEICEIAPGPNGVFNGAASFGDDVVTLHSIAAYGITDVEGIVYDPLWDTLVVADRGTRDLYELSPQGGYLRKIDVTFPISTPRPSGITIAPGSANPMLRNYWVTRECRVGPRRLCPADPGHDL